jgi:hypothetical protein
VTAGPPIIAVTINGRPVTEGSATPVLSRTTGRPFVKQTARMLKHRRKVIAALVVEWTRNRPDVPAPHPTAVIVQARFDFRRPDAHYRSGTRHRHTRTELRPDAPDHPTTIGVGDLDKLERLVGDALTLAGILVDDRLIVGWSTRKAWADVDRTILRVWPADSTT